VTNVCGRINWIFFMVYFEKEFVELCLRLDYLLIAMHVPVELNSL
jgi:hypothetical protein